jgi:hypothetical protein
MEQDIAKMMFKWKIIARLFEIKPDYSLFFDDVTVKY